MNPAPAPPSSKYKPGPGQKFKPGRFLPTSKEITQAMAEQLENLWKRASIPCVTSARIIAMIKSYHDKVTNISKSMKNKTNCVKLQSKLKAFIEDDRTKLFDISTCKCASFQACNCPTEHQVPKEEQKFLTDQKRLRKMIIGSLDKIIT